MKTFCPTLLAFCFLIACPRLTGPTQQQQALKALNETIGAAKENQVTQFKAGLSQNFLLTIDRFQELAANRPEIKGAFTLETFMRSLIRSNPQPTEVLLKKDHIIIKAKKNDGVITEVKMIQEKGKWVLAVPVGMVKSLDHFDTMANQKPPQKNSPNQNVKGGGSRQP